MSYDQGTDEIEIGQDNIKKMENQNKTESQKIEEKRALLLQGNIMLSDDSLTGEIINPEFIAIEQDLNRILKRPIQQSREEKRSKDLVNALLNGKKISLGC